MSGPIKRTRDVSKFGNYETFRHNTLKDALLSGLQAGFHTIHLNNRYFDFIFERHNRKTLFVTFSAAAGNDKITYPIFSGKNLASHEMVDWLALSDAAQAAPEGLKTSWHLGTEKMPTKDVIVALIRQLRKKYGYSHIVFFGSSAGGFAALNIGRHFTGSTSVVMNPRVDLKTTPTTFDEYSAYGNPSIKKLPPEDLSMSFAYSFPTGNRVVYIQNLQDESYYKNHYLPFTTSNRNPIVSITGNWGQGHVVPPEWVYKSVLDIVFRGKEVTDDFFDTAITRPKSVSDDQKIARIKRHATGSTFNAHSSDLTVADKLVSGLIVIPGRPDVETNGPIDWAIDPYSDNNWKFNLHSLRWADPLRRIFLKTRDPRYLKKYRQILHSWYKYHIYHGRHTPYSWYDMATGTRVKVLAAAFGVLDNEDWLEQLTYQHGVHLSHDKFQNRSGNHTLHAMIGLLIAGDFFSRQDWITRSTSKISSLFDECVDDQGVDYEGALQYQINNFRWYTEAAEHIRLVTGKSAKFHDKLRLMPEFLAHATTTTGYYLQYGDSDRMAASNNLGSRLLQWAGTRGGYGESPKQSFISYRSGYTFGRTGWQTSDFHDGIFYSIRHGAPFKDTPHGQFDSGSLTLTRGDSDLIFESGRFRYDKSEETEYLNSAAAHSTVLEANTIENIEAETSLIVSKSNPVFDWTTVCKAIDSRTMWFRTVIHLRGQKSLLVVDDFDNDEESDLTQFWQLGSQVQLGQNKRSIFSHDESTKSGVQLNLLTNGSLKAFLNHGATRPLAGWRSSKHGQITPSSQVKLVHTGTNIRVATLISDARDPKGSIEQTDQIEVSGMQTSLSSGHISQLLLGVGDERMIIELPDCHSYASHDHSIHFL